MSNIFYLTDGSPIPVDRKKWSILLRVRKWEKVGPHTYRSLSALIRRVGFQNFASYLDSDSSMPSLRAGHRSRLPTIAKRMVIISVVEAVLEDKDPELIWKLLENESMQAILNWKSPPIILENGVSMDDALRDTDNCSSNKELSLHWSTICTGLPEPARLESSTSTLETCSIEPQTLIYDGSMDTRDNELSSSMTLEEKRTTPSLNVPSDGSFSCSTDTPFKSLLKVHSSDGIQTSSLSPVICRSRSSSPILMRHLCEDDSRESFTLTPPSETVTSLGEISWPDYSPLLAEEWD